MIIYIVRVEKLLASLNPPQNRIFKIILGRKKRQYLDHLQFQQKKPTSNSQVNPTSPRKELLRCKHHKQLQEEKGTPLCK